MPEAPEHSITPQTVGAQMPRIAQQFQDDGALGVLVVDAGPLAEIEVGYGGAAYRRALANLATLVEELVGEHLLVTDLIAAGESGSELAVLLFREPGEIDFYKRELEALGLHLAKGLSDRGHRVGYPYTRALGRLEIGVGTALRNPTIREEAQVLTAIDDAREHLRLRAKLASRRRRSQLFELVIEGQIRSVYEPIVEVESRTVFGYEALARGPEGSELHSPMTLFKRASEEDLTFQLDCLCRQRGLDGARDLPGGAKLFLNVRPTSIHDPNFRADAVERTLARCQLSPSDVVFEISEQESIGNFAIFREVRDYYAKLGFQIALNDVGAGYASLEAVMELAPEFIKVDRAFVAGIDEDEGASGTPASAAGPRAAHRGPHHRRRPRHAGRARDARATRHPVRPGLALRQAAPVAQRLIRARARSQKYVAVSKLTTVGASITAATFLR